MVNLRVTKITLILFSSRRIIWKFHGSSTYSFMHKINKLRILWNSSLVRRYCKVRELEREGGAPAGCWNWCEWGLKVYKWSASFLGWFVGLIALVQVIFILHWLLQSAQYKIFFSVPSSRKLDRQPCWVACLLVCVTRYRRTTKVRKKGCCNVPFYFWIYYCWLTRRLRSITAICFYWT